MTTKAKHILVGLPKKAYKTPKLRVLGSVKKLTLKVGSDTDMMGGHL